MSIGLRLLNHIIQVQRCTDVEGTGDKVCNLVAAVGEAVAVTRGLALGLP